MHTIFARMIALASLCTCAHAQTLQSEKNGPAGSDGPPFSCSFNGQQIELRDEHAPRPRVLMGGSTHRLLYNTGLQPQVRFEPAERGGNLVFTYINTGDQPAGMTRVVLDGIRFGPHDDSYFFLDDSSTRPLPGYDAPRSIARYPNDLYSPVVVLADRTHTLGISVLYPVLEYAHAVEFILTGVPEASADRGGPHWSLEISFGEIPAHSTRVYTVACRGAVHDESFLTTLDTYRAYFHERYGEVTYVRDGRRVAGEGLAQVSDLGPLNPRGYKIPELRPDLWGWGPWTNALLNSPSRGYERLMLWAPSGVMPAHTGLNFPFRFMSPIRDLPVAWDTFGELTRLGAAGIDLGFWWGNSITITRGWEQPTIEGLNPENPEHRTLAFDELDQAVAAGARLIGLDAFRLSNPSRLYQWMLQMRARAPHVKFVTEHALPDFMHTLAPTFHEAIRIRTPHLLADFLNPGHETWAAISTTPEAEAEGREATLAEIRAEVERVESLGYVALVYGRPPMSAPGPQVERAEPIARVGAAAAARFDVRVGVADGPVTYLWRRDGVPISDGVTSRGTLVSGARSRTLNLANVTSSDIAVYSVVVRDQSGASATPGVPLVFSAANCPRDFNRDGEVDPDDLGDFLNCFFTLPCPGADANRDGNIDPDDLGDYINIFFGGCA
ncbi:MAG: hypothetical protein AB7K52_09465 [Phycisphaerales bacterium]